MDAKPAKDSAKISFQEWNWGVNFDGIVSKAVTAVLREMFEDSPPKFMMWARGEGDEPLAITVELPLGPDEFDPPSWEVSLPLLVEEWLNDFGRDSPECRRGMAEALRHLADKVDGATN